MQSNVDTLNDRRGGSQQKLATLVQTRSDTLALYTELVNHRPFEADEMVSDALQEFCQALIDYTASAHFQLYKYITDKCERRISVLDIAEQVYPQIAHTTDQILDFNDRYEKVDLSNGQQAMIESLDSDLSSLGETLAERIQLEDKVIGALAVAKH